MILGPARPRPPASRRGSVYVLVLAITALVVTIGLAGLAASRVRLRTVALEEDWNDAALLAQSAVDHVLMKIHDDYWWRYTLQDYESTFAPEIAFGRGTFTWRLDDLNDNDLTNSDAHPVRVYGLGRVGESARAFSVVAWPSGQPLDVLRTAIHADGTLTVAQTLDVRLGPASANGSIGVSGGLILGDVEAPAVDAPENVTGTVTQPAPPKTMPSRVLWQVYKSLATEIKYTDILALGGGAIEGVVLSPASNPYDPSKTDANGLYYVKVPALTELKIRTCRIEGTLLVELAQDGAKLTIGPEVLWNAARLDFPSLIVYTKADVSTTVTIECSGVLDEFLAGFNANPSHTPYYGDSDASLDDTYPAALRGVFHVIRETSLPPTSRTDIIAPRRITGCIIAEGDVRVSADTIIAADTWLASHPPLGYTKSPSPDTILVNGDMEAGLAGWSPVGGATIVTGGSAHTGSARIGVTNRPSAAGGICQDVTGQITSGETYSTNVWLQMRDAPEDVKITLEIATTDGGTQRETVLVPAVGKTWTLATVQHTPTWSGTLDYARWIVTTTTSAQEFRIDDASLEPLSPDRTPRLQVVPGTWRAEAVTP